MHVPVKVSVPFWLLRSHICPGFWYLDLVWFLQKGKDSALVQQGQTQVRLETVTRLLSPCLLILYSLLPTHHRVRVSPQNGLSGSALLNEASPQQGSVADRTRVRTFWSWRRAVSPSFPQGWAGESQYSRWALQVWGLRPYPSGHGHYLLTPNLSIQPAIYSNPFLTPDLCVHIRDR